MPVIGATQLEPVNVLGSYLQGMEIGRANRLARAQEAAAAQQAQQEAEFRNYLSTADLSSPEVQNQLLRFGPQGAELAKNISQMGAQRAQQAASEASREKSLVDIDTAKRTAGRELVTEAINFVTAANPRTYGQLYRQAVEKYGPEQIGKLGLTEQYDPELLGSLGQSLINTKDRLDQQLRAREVRASEGRLAVDETRARLEQRRVDLEDRRVALEELKAQPGYQEVKIDQKTRAAREKAFPKASAAFRSATNDIDTLIKDLQDLRAHPGLPAITGGVEGRAPSFFPEATAAQAKLDKILAKGQFRSLQALRDASATGGAVGNVSDKEGQALRDSFGALSQTQQDEDFREQIDDVIKDLEFSKNNITQAYDDEYAYRGTEPKPTGRRGDPTKRRGSDAAAIRSEADAILGQ
jgi:hypothetical protein